MSSDYNVIWECAPVRSGHIALNLRQIMNVFTHFVCVCSEMHVSVLHVLKRSVCQ